MESVRNGVHHETTVAELCKLSGEAVRVETAARREHNRAAEAYASTANKVLQGRISQVKGNATAGHPLPIVLFKAENTYLKALIRGGSAVDASALIALYNTMDDYITRLTLVQTSERAKFYPVIQKGISLIQHTVALQLQHSHDPVAASLLAFQESTRTFFTKSPEEQQAAEAVMTAHFSELLGQIGENQLYKLFLDSAVDLFNSVARDGKPFLSQLERALEKSVFKTDVQAILATTLEEMHAALNEVEKRQEELQHFTTQFEANPAQSQRLAKWVETLGNHNRDLNNAILEASLTPGTLSIEGSPTAMDTSE